jgi:hypothetical protein
MAATIIELPTAASRRNVSASTEPSVRKHWRAIVRTGGLFAASREGDRVEWHLVECDAPHGAGEHCSEGERLLALTGNPSGHCLIDGVCGTCGEVAETELRRAA